MTYSGEELEGATILIVDDVEINRVILEEIIHNIGCHAVLAENGEEALKLVKEKAPQLILSDISMPGMNGYELCRRIKEREETREIPVIFISAFDSSEDIVEGFSHGGEDYITKPFIPEEVQARVSVHLKLHEMTAELKAMNRRLQISVNEQLRQMEQEKKNILYALADIAAQNSFCGKEYIKRLQENCRTLTQGMQLSPLFEEKISDTYIDTIELAVPLCDIGNIGVPRELLLKKTELSEEDAAIVQSHTSIGAKLLSDLYGSSDYNDFINISVEMIRCHHEKWDGSGYPEGLRGKEIPLAAQIAAVVMRYCELTADAGMDRENALAVMREESGVKFNPDIFEICCKISRQLC